MTLPLLSLFFVFPLRTQKIDVAIQYTSYISVHQKPIDTHVKLDIQTQKIRLLTIIICCLLFVPRPSIYFIITSS